MPCGCLSFLFGDASQKTKNLLLEQEAAPTLRILTANDVYKPERFAMLKTLATINRGPGVTKLVLPGDLLGGSLFATSHRGESVVEVLNALRVDYCTLGNHEFDYGADRTEELMDRSKFPWLGSNVREAGRRGIFHTTMDYDTFAVDAGGSTGTVMVGVFGLCTPATPELSHPGPRVVFESPVEHAKRCVQELQAQGCEVILALTHLSLAVDKQVAEECPGIRAILGGHDHDPFFLVHHGTLIAKCGQNADHMGVLDLHLHRAGPCMPLASEHSFQLLSTARVPAALEVIEAATPFHSSNGHEDDLCRVAGVALSTLSQELRTRENAFGCYVADAIHWSCRDHGCEAAIQNGGFVRQDAMYPVDTNLSASQVREEMPFPKRPVLLKLSGALLRQGLEEMLASAPAAAGSFPQLSEGLSLAYNPDAPKFRKISRLDVAGEPVDPHREYLVAISEFYTLKGGDGVEAFTQGVPIFECSELIREIAVRYFRHLGTVSGQPPGRLVREP